LNISQYNLCK